MQAPQANAAGQSATPNAQQTPSSQTPNNAQQNGPSTMPPAGNSAATVDQLPQSDIETGSPVVESKNLRSEIQGAFDKEPTLAGSAILVNVTATTIQLNGTAASGTQKQTARRIAESYALNRRVDDKVKVAPPPAQK